MWGMGRGKGRAYIQVGLIFRLPKHPVVNYVVVTDKYFVQKKRQGT